MYPFMRNVFVFQSIKHTLEGYTTYPLKHNFQPYLVLSRNHPTDPKHNQERMS